MPQMVEPLALQPMEELPQLDGHPVHAPFGMAQYVQPLGKGQQQFLIGRVL